VSKANKSSVTSSSKTEELPFEEALGKLEAIVDAMESDDLPLETLLARFEEGTRLSRLCQARLAEAELKIQQLEKESDGELTLKAVAETEPGSDH
jgi:exodeoxyribonuclease VII small subunit